MSSAHDATPLGEDDLARAQAFIATIEPRFTVASTVPEHPHAYIARAWLTPELQAEFHWLVRLIYATGYTGRYWGSTWSYVDLGGWSYWPSQSWYGPDAGKPNTMLNRRRLDTGQLRLEVDR